MTDEARRETSTLLGAGAAGLMVAGMAEAQYVDAFMRNVNWEEVDRRFASRA